MNYLKYIFTGLLAAFYIIESSAQDINRVRSYLDTLCSPYMSGRGYLNEGDKKAAEFIKNEFENIGIKAFKGNYFQKFKFDINTFPNRVLFKTDKKVLKPGEDYIVNCISGPGKGKYKVEYLDTLIFTDKEVQEKFLQSSLRKKAFVYKNKDYKKLTELPLEYLQKIHESPCVIELQQKKLIMGLSQKQLSHPFFLVNEEDFDPLTEKVKIKLDAELIHNYESQNVIGYIKGKTEPDSFIIISAHYDHLGKMGKQVYFPGANDNASGTSMLLELARYFSTPANQPDYTIVFIAFGAEEAGLIGSKYYTENPIFPLRRIKFLINLDLLGTGDDGMMVVNGAIFDKEFELLTKINEDKRYLPAIKKRGEAANSDHYYFTEKGVPSFFFYTLGGIAAYHDILDIPETLPLTRFKEVFSLIVDFIGQL